MVTMSKVFKLNHHVEWIKRKSNPDIQKWMTQMNYTDYHQLEAYYSTRTLNIAKDLNKKVTVWQGKAF